MKVRATQMGQYKGRMYEPGDIFEIEKDEHYPTHWMEAVGDPQESTPEEPAKKENLMQKLKRRVQ